MKNNLFKNVLYNINILEKNIFEAICKFMKIMCINAVFTN